MKSKGQIFLFILSIGCSVSQKPDHEMKSVAFNSPTEFFNEREQSLSREFGLLFEPVINQLDSVTFYVLDSTVYNVDNDRKVFSMVIRGQGSKNWSSCQKVIVVSNTGQVVFESPLTQIVDIQPECGVPDYKIDTIFHAAVSNREYLMTQVSQYFYSCVGQPLTDRKILYVNSTEDYKQIDTLVTFQHIVSQDGNEQLRQADIGTDKEGLFIRIIEKKGEPITYRIFDEGLKKERK
jgi:hypothetical protein